VTPRQLLLTANPSLGLTCPAAAMRTIAAVDTRASEEDGEQNQTCFSSEKKRDNPAEAYAINWLNHCLVKHDY
jgi:hypothetical protein